MPDIYSKAWEILSDRIARSRRQSISKTDLLEWRLQALEAAVNRVCFEEEQHGLQEAPQTPPV